MLLAGQVTSSSAVSLTVNVTGYKSWNGFVRIAVFNSSEFWPEDKDNAVFTITSPINSDTVSIEIPELEQGEYAVAAFHDEDGDAVFDRGLFSVPTERYGFSNNARSSSGPPDYRDATFTVEGDPLTVTVVLR